MEQSRTDFERELLMLTEAWAIENNVNITRRFTHNELAPYILKVREAARDVAQMAKEPQ